jgi:hypothetical protein
MSPRPGPALTLLPGRAGGPGRRLGLLAGGKAALLVGLPAPGLPAGALGLLGPRSALPGDLSCPGRTPPPGSHAHRVPWAAARTSGLDFRRPDLRQGGRRPYLLPSVSEIRNRLTSSRPDATKGPVFKRFSRYGRAERVAGGAGGESMPTLRDLNLHHPLSDSRLWGLLLPHEPGTGRRPVGPAVGFAPLGAATRCPESERQGEAVGCG